MAFRTPFVALAAFKDGSSFDPLQHATCAVLGMIDQLTSGRTFKLGFDLNRWNEMISSVFKAVSTPPSLF